MATGYALGRREPALAILHTTAGYLTQVSATHKLVFDLTTSPQTTFDALKHLALDEAEEDLLADATRGAGNALTRVRFVMKGGIIYRR
mgnify:CR=1 FL=1